MENASKALIIAGAILISILLISVGIIVMNSINDPIEQSTDEATQQAIQMFNSKFTGYAGRKKASDVKALMTIVQSVSGTKNGHEVKVLYTGTDDGGNKVSNVSDAATIQTYIKSSKSYVVKIEDTATAPAVKDGYVDTITITEK